MPVTETGRGRITQSVVLFAFIAGIVVLIVFLYAQAGTKLPGQGGQRAYKIAFDVPTTANVLEFVDVYTAGVPIGKVDSVTRVNQDNNSPNKVRITLGLDEVVTPLHEGTTVQISEKALTGQPMIRLVQGNGAKAYDSGEVLPQEAVRPPVQLRDVLASLDRPTRDALGGFTRSLSASTDGRQKDVSGIFAGLSDLGKNGDTVLQALGSQSADLMAMSDQLKQVGDAVDVGQGQIFQLVASANRLTAATAGQRASLEESLRKLPGVLDSATAASADVNRLTGSLRPVAAKLKDASGDLNQALNDLPEASRHLRKSLDPLEDVLDRAPDTFDRTGKFKKETHDFVPPATVLLRDLNPILRYAEPWGKDLASFFTNTDAGLRHFTADKQVALRLKPVAGLRSIGLNPVELPQALAEKDPYPAGGTQGIPNLPILKFPRIERDN